MNEGGDEATGPKQSVLEDLDPMTSDRPLPKWEKEFYKLAAKRGVNPNSPRAVSLRTACRMVFGDAPDYGDLPRGIANPPPLFVALEASDPGPRGYPIEIGWSDPNGDSEAFLIRPLITWRSWPWSEKSQALHEIDRQTLTRFGHPAASAVHVLLMAAAGRRLYCADVARDESWLALVLEAANLQPIPELKLACAKTLFQELSTRYQMPFAPIEALARASAPPKHRAEYDARHLATIYRIFEGEILGRADADTGAPWPPTSRASH